MITHLVTRYLFIGINFCLLKGGKCDIVCNETQVIRAWGTLLINYLLLP